MEGSSTAKVRLLFISANPDDTVRLNLDQEYNAIDAAIRKADYRDDFELVQSNAVSRKNLQEILLRFQPDIVHFSGHGTERGTLVFRSKSGLSEEISPEALADLFAIVNRNRKIRCVVLNACYSDARQTRAIAKNVDAVIGVSSEISDASATSFAESFYQALAYGKNVKDAFALGRNELHLEDTQEEKAPQLNCRRGIDPDKLFFAGSEAAGYYASATTSGGRDGSEKGGTGRRQITIGARTVRAELLIAIVGSAVAAIITLAAPALAASFADMFAPDVGTIAPVTEDCESFTPSAVSAVKIGSDWKVIDNRTGFQMLDFKTNQDNAELAARVIQAHSFSKMCFVGRPYNAISNPVLPMMYFLSNGTAPQNNDALDSGQNCKAINPQSATYQKIGGNWVVLDGNIKIYDFGSSQKSEQNAATAAKVIKLHGFDKVCVIDRPFQPMMYFVSLGGEHVLPAAGPARPLFSYLPGPQEATFQVLQDEDNNTGPITTLIPDGSGPATICQSCGGTIVGGPGTVPGPGNSTRQVPSNSTTTNPCSVNGEPGCPVITRPTNNEVLASRQFTVAGGLSSTSDSTGDPVTGVEVRIDGSLDTPSVADQFNPQTGSWSYRATVGSDGFHSIEARANYRDSSNPSTWSSPVLVRVDTVPPQLTVSSPSDGTAMMRSGGSLTVTGSASDPGGSGLAKVEASLDGSPFQVLAGTASWSYSPPAGALSSEGAHRISIKATDNAKNPTTRAVTVLTDNGPAVTAGPTVSPSPASAPPRIAATATSLANSRIAAGECVVGPDASAVQTRVALSAADGAYDEVGEQASATMPQAVFDALPQGLQTVQCHFRDAAGVWGPTAPATFAKDTVPPEVAINSPAGGATVAAVVMPSGGFTIRGISSDQGSGVGRVEVMVDGGPAHAASGSASWSVTLPSLSEGAHTVTAVATDNAGNRQTTQPVSFTVGGGGSGTIDPAPPVIIMAPAEGEFVNTQTPVISGTAPAGSTVTVREGSAVLGQATAAAAAGGAWSMTPSMPLADGPHTITSQSVLGGVTSQAEAARVFMVDTLPPGIDIVAPASGSAVSVPFAVSGSAHDAASGVQKVEIGTDAGDFEPLPGTASWSKDVDSLPAGDHVIRVRATDKAGNSFVASLAVVIINPPEQSASTNNPPAVIAGGNDDDDDAGDDDGDGGNSGGGSGSNSGAGDAASDGKGSGPRPFTLHAALEGDEYLLSGTVDGGEGGGDSRLVVPTSASIDPQGSLVRIDFDTAGGGGSGGRDGGGSSYRIEISFPAEMIGGIYEVRTEQGQAVSFQQTGANATAVSIAFDVPADTSYVLVSGTRVVPEFGPSALAVLPASVILASGISAILAMARRRRASR